MSDTHIAMIAAVAENGVIGADNAMPWRLSTDLKRFKSLTMGKPIIMGRKTYESVGKALPGRLNIVVSRSPAFAPDDAHVVHSLDQALDVARQGVARSGAEEIMVTGGGQIYRQAMADADRLYITHVSAMPDGDTVFPPIDMSVWHIVQEEKVPAGERDSAATVYRIYERNRPAGE
ncbi:MAG: dihydrofolate reductase [Pseudomonadota bacterium]